MLNLTCSPLLPKRLKNDETVLGKIKFKSGCNVKTRTRVDLCIIDIMMPKKDGFTFAKELRQTDKQIPIIFLTAKSLKEDRIEGLKIGADDYITKPFSMEELLLRINAVLKRTSVDEPNTTTATEFTIGKIHFDVRKSQLKVSDKKIIALTTN